MTKLAIVGIFFDGYYDLWEDFLELFEMNWGECPFPLYIINNEKNLKFEKNYNVQVFHAGKDAEYSRKVQLALEKIDAEYYLLLLEDFFIGEQLNRDVLSSTLNYIDSNKIRYYRMPLNEFISNNKKGKVEKISPSMEYTLSCQPSIWKKSFLKECIGEDNYNAWIFEGIYVKSQKAHTVEFLKGCYVDYRNILRLYHGALQGKILRETYIYFKKRGYTFRTKRGIINRKERIKHKLKRIIDKNCPHFLRQIVKIYYKKNSVIEKYDKEINILIKKLKL